MRSDIINKNSGSYIDALTPETLLEWNYVTCGGTYGCQCWFR